MEMHTQSGEADSLTIELSDDEAVQSKAEIANSALLGLEKGDYEALLTYLRTRLQQGSRIRDMRASRMIKIDRMISTWQKLDKADSERERMEDNSGKSQAIPFNLPILATHLQDMVSYFTESLAPISNPFVTSDGKDELKGLTAALNKDALARDYYGQLTLTIRSLLKYNLGGMTVEWDTGETTSVGLTGLKSTGNDWRSLDPYNTLWDATLRNPRELPFKGEWGATVQLTNRIEMARRGLAGEWVNLDDILRSQSRNAPLGTAQETYPSVSLWRDPSAAVPEGGQDSRTSRDGPSGEDITPQDWESIGLGASDYGDGVVRHYELSTMFCWILPEDFGLLSDADRALIQSNNQNPDTYLELWRFQLLDGATIVTANPALDRQKSIEGEVAQIPMYLCYMTDDQLAESQRSMMELMKGFQRFASAMYSIYVNGMRSNVWGLKGYDPSMFDVDKLERGEVAGWLAAKIPGRDVRSGMMPMSSASGVDGTMQALNSSMGLKDSMFPSQALPSQVAGMDRAVTSQVSTVVQGAQRSMRATLRSIDSAMMLPSRMEAVRNIQRYDSETAGTFENVTDEEVAKSLGSGIESMESERVVEGFWRLLMAITQNQESMQAYNVPAILEYLGRLMNLSVDMQSFVKQQPQQPQQSQEQGAPQGQGTPGAPTQG